MSRERKAALPQDDPEQSKRFIETAKEIGTDESPEAFERVFSVVTKGPSIPPDRAKKT